MIPTGNEIRSYFIVFTDNARLNWFYKLFTRKGFRHCEVIMAVGDRSIGVCHTYENVEVTLYKETVLEAIEKIKKKNVKILYLQTNKKPRKITYGIIIPSCVGSCQLITGVSFNVLSVHGYYKKLLKHGAQIV